MNDNTWETHVYQPKKMNFLNDNTWETHVYQPKKINYLNDNTWQTHVCQAKKTNYLNGFYWLNVNWFMSWVVTTLRLFEHFQCQR